MYVDLKNQYSVDDTSNQSCRMFLIKSHSFAFFAKSCRLSDEKAL